MAPGEALAQERQRPQELPGGDYQLSATAPLMCQARLTDARVESDSLVLIIERTCNVGHTLNVNAPPTLAGAPVTVTDRRSGRTVSIDEAEFVSLSPVGRTDELIVRAEGADEFALLDYARQLTVWAAPI